MEIERTGVEIVALVCELYGLPDAEIAKVAGRWSHPHKQVTLWNAAQQR